MEKMQGMFCKIDLFSQFLVKCVFSVPLTFLAIPSFTFIFFLFFTYRTLVMRVARCVGNPDLREPLDLGSVGISHLESPFKLTPSWPIVGKVVFEGVPDIEKIRKQVRKKYFGRRNQKGKPFYPELLQTMEYFMGYPFWKRIPGMAVKKASDKYVTSHKRIGGWDANSVQDFAKTLAVKQFKEGGPLWEICILENYTLPGSTEPHFAMVVRIHHILTDGIGYLSLLQELGDDPSLNTDRTRMTLPLGYRVYKALSPIFRGVYDVTSFALNWEVVATRNSLWPKSISPPPNSEAPKLIAEGNPGFCAAHSFYLGPRCSTLTSVKKISKSWGVSGTAVILTAILRSVRNTSFPVHSILPTYVNMVITLPSGENNNGKLTNTAILVNFLLPLYVENPITHAKEVGMEFLNVKENSFPYVMGLVNKLGGMVPHFIAGPLLRNWWNTRPEHLLLSTMIGPKEPFTVCGHMTKSISYLLPRSDSFKYPMFQLFSTVDKLYLNLTADKSLIQDDAMAQRIVMKFHDEIENFQKF